MKTFQKPLCARDEKIYLKKFQNGDLSAKDVLIEHNMRLVAHVVKKYQGVAEEHQNLIIYTANRITGQFSAFIIIERVHRFNQANGANRD